MLVSDQTSIFVSDQTSIFVSCTSIFSVFHHYMLQPVAPVCAALHQYQWVWSPHQPRPTTRCGRGLPILPASWGAPLYITYHTIVVSDAETEEGSWIPTEEPSHKDAAHEYKFCDLQNYSQSKNCNIVQPPLYHKMGNFDGVKIWRLRLKTRLFFQFSDS